jgi:hypothetical protein
MRSRPLSKRILRADTLRIQNEQESFTAIIALKTGIPSFSDALIGALGLWAQMALHQPSPRRKKKYIEAGFVHEPASYPALTAAAAAAGLLVARGLFFFTKAGQQKSTTPS